MESNFFLNIKSLKKTSQNLRTVLIVTKFKFRRVNVGFKVNKVDDGRLGGHGFTACKCRISISKACKRLLRVILEVKCWQFQIVFGPIVQASISKVNKVDDGRSWFYCR